MSVVKRSLCAALAVLSLAGAGLAANPKAAPAAKPTKPAADKGRITRTDLGFSYVAPEGYFPSAPHHIPTIDEKLYLEGPRTTQNNIVGTIGRAYITDALATCIEVIVMPRGKELMSADSYSPDLVKERLDQIGHALRNTGMTLNYQNSAIIKVAGHDAVAILAESTVPPLSDRAMCRLIILDHRGQRYIFYFEATDTEFETKVPAFEAFIKSLKFLQPNVTPPATPTGPINIQITN